MRLPPLQLACLTLWVWLEPDGVGRFRCGAVGWAWLGRARARGSVRFTYRRLFVPNEGTFQSNAGTFSNQTRALVPIKHGPRDARAVPQRRGTPPSRTERAARILAHGVLPPLGIPRTPPCARLQVVSAHPEQTEPRARTQEWFPNAAALVDALGSASVSEWTPSSAAAAGSTIMPLASGALATNQRAIIDHARAITPHHF